MAAPRKERKLAPQEFGIGSADGSEHEGSQPDDSATPRWQLLSSEALDELHEAAHSLPQQGQQMRQDALESSAVQLHNIGGDYTHRREENRPAPGTQHRPKQ